MAETLDIKDWLARLDTGLPVVDVRSPSEYAHAHIPGAVSIPLFDDAERADVGTIYTKVGKTQAVQRGLEYVGPKLRRFTEEALALGSGELLVYCWRGGMRSGAMSWLFGTVGLKCFKLDGGYKAYRNHVLDSFACKYDFVVLGGCTGSGKTDVLKELAGRGYQVLDLEGLANHKGSAFGSMGEAPQPSNEMFEHLVFDTLRRFDPAKPVFVEDESSNIGRVFVPRAVFAQIRTGRLVEMDTDYGVRLDRIMKVYAAIPPQEIAPYILKIEKRMGRERCKQAYEACMAGDVTQAAEMCLAYYDKMYRSQLETRRKEASAYELIKCTEADVTGTASEIIKLTDKR